MSASGALWRAFPDDQLLWVAGGDGLKDGALAVADERRISCSQVLCLEQLEVAANLKLELPFFANELLGAVHLHGPLGLDTILDFCHHLHSVLEKAGTQVVCLTCSRRPGAVANSLLLLGAFLILDKGYTASKVMRIIDASSPTNPQIPASELRFPTPFLERPHFTQDSLVLADCLFGLEMALCKEWLLQQLDEEKRQIARAYDAVPVFSLLLQGKGREHETPVTVQFWIAADPVTTVEDPSKRDANTLPENQWTSEDVDLSPPPDGFTRAVSEQGDHHGHQAVRVVKSAEHIHTLDEDGTVALTPQHVYAARSRGHAFMSLAKTTGQLPTKVHREKSGTIGPQMKRPANLATFAHFLRRKISCSLLTRANFPDERGLPGGGSYGNFFQRFNINQLDLPFPDGTAPPSRLVSRLIAAVEQLLQDIVIPKEDTPTIPTAPPQTHYSVVVHCKSGLGRSMSLLAALAVAFSPGMTAGAFFGWARLVRPACLQTPAQERFLRSLDEPAAGDCSCLFACFGKKQTFASPTSPSEGSRGTSLRSSRTSNGSIIV